MCRIRIFDFFYWFFFSWNFLSVRKFFYKGNFFWKFFLLKIRFMLCRIRICKKKKSIFFLWNFSKCQKCAKKGSLQDHFPFKKIQNSFKYSLNKWFRMGKSVVVVEKKIKCHLGLTLAPIATVTLTNKTFKHVFLYPVSQFKGSMSSWTHVTALHLLACSPNGNQSPTH